MQTHQTAHTHARTHTHTHTHTNTHIHSFDYHTVQVTHHTAHTHITHTELRLLHSASQTLHTHTHITVRAHREQAHRQGTLHTITRHHIQQPPQCASCKTCSFVCVHIQMGSTKNEQQQHKLQRVKTILGTSRSRMQSRKVVRQSHMST